MPMKLGFKAADVLRQKLVKKDDINEIVLWLKEEQLPAYSDEQIIQFLLSCDNALDDTKKTIRSYVEITNSCDEIFSNKNCNRSDLQQYFAMGEICILPERTPDGCVILFNRMSDYNYRKFEMLPYLTVLTMTIESGLYDFPASGLIVVIDVTGMTWKCATRMRLNFMRIFTHYLQEGLPVKLRKIYFINAIPILDTFIKIIRPFVKKEVMDKLQAVKPDQMYLFHEKCLTKHYFPVDYGGNKPSVKVLYQKQLQKFQDLLDYFETEEKQRKAVLA